MSLKITILGAGYVGMSLAAVLFEKYDVIVFDIDREKIDALNNRKAPFREIMIEKALDKPDIKLLATNNFEIASTNRDIYIIATPTNYDEQKSSFDTDSVELSIKNILANSMQGLIVIKSTVPVGFTKKMQKKYNTSNIIFSPEFLREGSAMQDNLTPSRIIIGGKNTLAKKFGRIMLKLAQNDAQLLFMDSSEAEAIKLFSNTYLALRVAFFNELDSYSLSKKLDTESIIKGVCLDPRIGNFYNNPSFGYGGYCLPKDTKQLLANYENVPQILIRAVISANEIRKEFIANQIIDMKPKVVGIYGLGMKKDSDNTRDAAVHDIIKKLISQNITLIVYEPNIKDIGVYEYKFEKSLSKFKEKVDIILANRDTEELSDVSSKVFSRDLFREL